MRGLADEEREMLVAEASDVVERVYGAEAARTAASLVERGCMRVVFTTREFVRCQITDRGRLALRADAALDRAAMGE